MEASFTDYLGTWSEELVSRADRVRHLIGNAHWLSDGHHKEAIVREFLRRHLPTRYRVGRGFIRPPDMAVSCSPEIDILIHDDQSHPPLFNEGDLTIVPPHGVCAYFGIKSQLTATTLRESLAHIVGTNEIISKYCDVSKVWTGILFASAPESRTAESLAKTFVEIIRDQPTLISELPKAVTTRPTRIAAQHLPTCVATLDGFACFVSVTDKIQLRIFASGSISAGCIFCDLFSHLSAHLNGTRLLELAQIVSHSVSGTPYVTELVL